uniref:C-type lectin domain-containing protein n=1 Tax=Steinernema glaseri TaxID=37863 RepID=A0A1I7YAQ0_9BILA
MIRLVLLFLPISVAFAAQGCPPGAFASLAGDKCFNPVPLPTDFHTAEKICANAGGHLASIHNKYDNDVLDVSDHFGSYWLGGQDVNNDGRWTWTDGSSFNYNNWAAGGGMTGQDCLMLDGATALWQPSNCQQKANFICETSLSSPLTTSLTLSTPGPATPTTRVVPTTTLPPTTTSTLTTTAPPCTGNGTCVDGLCYVFVECRLSWYDALSNCKRMNGNLASVHNAQVELIIEQWNARVNDVCWIGGQFDENGNLSWSDGTSVDYTHWARGAPSFIQNNRCVMVTRYGWNNYSCTIAHSPSVCEIPIQHMISI